MRNLRDITLGEVAEGAGKAIRKGRDFLKDHSPVWLNLEINPELARKAFFAIAPALQYALGKVEEGIQFLLPPGDDEDELLLPGWEIRLLPPAPDQPKRKPHWKRTTKLFQLFDAAWAEAKHSYSSLIAHVKEQTGKGCSRRAIANWKRDRGLIEQ